MTAVSTPAPLAHSRVPQQVTYQKRQLRVLTLSPFYPSLEDPVQGRFVSEPLERIGQFGISNQTVAVRPFYRQQGHSLANDTAIWKQYLSVPGNAGLATAGEFLARGLAVRLTGEHQQNRFDLIHAHSALPCGHAALILSRHLSIPFVVTVHGLDAFFERQAGGLFGSWCRRAAKNVYRSARSVICISEKVRQEVLSGVRTDTAVIYNGVDTNVFSPDVESPSPLIVLSVGNLIPIKGHAVLLRAFAKTSEVIPNCVLEIIGDGPEREVLTRLAAELGVASKVHFLGRRSKQEVAEAMRRCAVFALPSAYEGLGCVYLEAMACAKPAIGSRGQGIDEVIEHGATGILVSPGNQIELAKSLQLLLENAALRLRIGAAARGKVSQRFTLEHQAQRLAEVYRECLA